MRKQELPFTCGLWQYQRDRGINPICNYELVIKGEERCFHYYIPGSHGPHNFSLVPRNCPQLIKIQEEKDLL